MRYLIVLCLPALAYAGNPVPQLDWGVPIDITDYACDATVLTGDSNWAKVNNASNAVVCIEAGDHTGKGDMNITDGGTAESPIDIGAITLSNPVQVDFPSAHGWSTDDIIWCDANVGGTWQMHWRYFKVTVVDSDSITLQGEDGTGSNLQPVWDAYTSGGSCKKINFKVIRHATALSSHPQQLAGGSKAQITGFNCDPSDTTSDDDYILIWGLSFPDHGAENAQNGVASTNGCLHFVVAYSEFTSSTAVPSNFIVWSDTSHYGVVQDSFFDLTTTSATQEANAVALLNGINGFRLVNSEIRDMTAHGITTIGGDFYGVVIAGNFFETTTDMYVDCNGTPNPSGVCACTEKAIEIKESIDPGRETGKSQFYRIEANMFKGFRKTANAGTCSGASTNTGGGIGGALGDQKYNILALNNVMWDMQHGIIWSGAAGIDVQYFSIVGNIFYEIDNPQDGSSSDWSNRSVVWQMFLDGTAVTNNEYYHNTVVNSDHWFVNNSAAGTTGDFSCNLIIDGGSRGGGLGSLTMDQNYVYGNTAGEQAGDTDGGATANANMADLTMQPYLISAPATDVILTDVLSTGSSPHNGDCTGIGASGFGVTDETVTY